MQSLIARCNLRWKLYKYRRSQKSVFIVAAVLKAARTKRSNNEARARPLRLHRRPIRSLGIRNDHFFSRREIHGAFYKRSDPRLELILKRPDRSAVSGFFFDYVLAGLNRVTRLIRLPPSSIYRLSSSAAECLNFNLSDLLFVHRYRPHPRPKKLTVSDSSVAEEMKPSIFGLAFIHSIYLISF